MLEGSLTVQGLMLMLYGMGTVAMFLLVLVISINLMAWICCRYFPETMPVLGTDESQSGQTGQDEVTAVISAAIHKYRSNRR